MYTIFAFYIYCYYIKCSNKCTSSIYMFVSLWWNIEYRIKIVGCGVGNICPIAQSATAYCDRCDFQDSTDKCGAVIGYHGNFKLPPLPDPTKNCVVDEEILYSGMDFSFKGNILQFL